MLNDLTKGYRFKQALQDDGLSIIAEIKRRSPSAGILKSDLDISQLVCDYRDGGASCLSVLTNETLFGGSDKDLREVARISELPILRKDFLTNFQDIEASQVMGADAVLLIVSEIEPVKLKSMHELALKLKMDVVTEIRHSEEFELAIQAGAYMIMVNQRNQPKSQSFSVDYDKALKMRYLFNGYDEIIKIAGSGINMTGGTNIAKLNAVGYDAALIGEALLTSADPKANLCSLLKQASESA